MQDFKPHRIFIHPKVQDLPVTKRILKYFSGVPTELAESPQSLKHPQEHTLAKRELFLTAHQGQAIKTCQGLGDYVCCQYYTIALISDCHLECTYCILQDYLKNNPRLTIFCNTDDIFEAVAQKAQQHPERLLRVGTGELSDSLALDHITQFSKDFVAFAQKHQNVLLELKTKTANVHNLLNLTPNKRTIVSWSVNPQSYIEREEHKCDSLAARLHAARQCADHGYPVAFHLDPLLYFDNWQQEYAGVVDQIAKNFVAKEIAWISIGSLRFTPELKKISQSRFPNSEIMTGELFPSQDGKMRYFRPLREEMYAFVKNELETKLKKVPHYLCMETRAVWQNVFAQVPATNRELEAHLVQNFV